MLTFENYIFNFHMWPYALAAATPQREAAFGFIQARETIISFGKFTKMFNLLLNCGFHFMKHFSKTLQNVRARQNEVVIGKAFWLLLWTSCYKLMGLQAPSNQREKQQHLLMEEQRDSECRNTKHTTVFHKTNLVFEQQQSQPSQI